MRKNLWLLPLLLLGTTSVLAANYSVEMRTNFPTDGGPYFYPYSLTIGAGDTVAFSNDVDALPHNVVADDGSFRCARGCDGEGGNGAPFIFWTFTRTFKTAGVVNYHDEVSHATGVIVVQDVPPFAIGPGTTGSWYDPAQSGHGLFIEVLSDNRFYATWFAFNPTGAQQAWFTGVGTYSGNAATVTGVVLPTGGRWIPNFDPSQVVRNAWGTLTFTFTDCDHGRVDFNSVLGYGTGSMNLTRLTQPAGLACP